MCLTVSVSKTLRIPILVSVPVVETKYLTRSHLETEGFVQVHGLKVQSMEIRKT